MDILLRGMILGFSVAAPVGPIGVLCIKRTLAEGRAYGLVSGLGAATANAFYGCIAALGLTFISSLLVSQQMWLRLIGGLFLCYLGVRTFLSSPVGQAASSGAKGLLGAYVSTLLLTVSNPTTIFSFAAVFSGLGLATGAADYSAALLLVLGVFTGSALWWLILSGGVSLLRSRVKMEWLRWVNKVSGGIIVLFGLLALFSLLM